MSFGNRPAIFATIDFDEDPDDVNAIGVHRSRALQAGPAACFEALAALGVAESKSEAKAKALLKEWLSSEQLAQYERNRWFEVVGSETGKRYRIQERQQQNVYELDAKGRPIRGWCFMPKRRLATGDVMLARKIALETDEKGAMKVALRFWSETGLSRFVRWVAATWGGL
jgi:hypothetical protein